MRSRPLTLLALTAAGCGSAALPPPAGPVGPPAPLLAGRVIAVVDGRARTLTLEDARTHARLAGASAGVGPTGVACADRGPCWVLDTRGDGLLVFAVGPEGRRLELTRRVALPGRPEDLRYDRARRLLTVTLTRRHEIVTLPAHGRPHVLSRRPA